MNLRLTKSQFAVSAAIVAAAVFCAPAMADDHGKGKGKGHDKKEKAERREEVREGAYFREEHREAARRYYVEQYGGHGKAKHCPPGLAKKHNGCMPPGQARKWAVGQPLPRDVVVYEVPRPVLVQLPPPPVGYRYERVGGDIVLVRINGRVVVDIMLNIFG
jgi:Ni/Co efflux regulator RcnB